MRPEKYLIRYETKSGDYQETNYPTQALARRATKNLTGFWQMWKRINVVDITPGEDGSGLLWDWEEELIALSSD